MFKKILIISMLFITQIFSDDNIIENQIGPFNLDSQRISEEQFIKEYGEGYVYDYLDIIRRHIYYDLDQEIWISIGFSHVKDREGNRYFETVIVTRNELCDKDFKPKKSFGQMATSKCVQINDPIEKIIDTYGEPTITIDISKSDLISSLKAALKLENGKVLRYLNQSGELLFSEFYFDNDKMLHSILISKSE